MAERFGRPPADPNLPAPAPVARQAEPDDNGFPEPAPAPAPVQASAPAPTPVPARHVGNPPTTPRPGAERLDLQVQKHQEELLNLRRQQEQIERQKRELEELSRRQEELETGRTDLIEKLTRALVVVERQSAEARKRVEQLQSTHESFQSHLSALEAINAKSWASADIQRELSRALGLVDHARTDFNQQKGRLVTESEDGGESEGSSVADRYDELFGGENDRSFLYFLKAGFAFTLPLVLVLLIVAFLLCWKLVNGSV